MILSVLSFYIACYIYHPTCFSSLIHSVFLYVEWSSLEIVCIGCFNLHAVYICIPLFYIKACAIYMSIYCYVVYTDLIVVCVCLRLQVEADYTILNYIMTSQWVCFHFMLFVSPCCICTHHTHTLSLSLQTA